MDMRVALPAYLRGFYDVTADLSPPKRISIESTLEQFCVRLNPRSVRCLERLAEGFHSFWVHVGRKFQSSGKLWTEEDGKEYENERKKRDIEWAAYARKFRASGLPRFTKAERLERQLPGIWEILLRRHGNARLGILQNLSGSNPPIPVPESFEMNFRHFVDTAESALVERALASFWHKPLADYNSQCRDFEHRSLAYHVTSTNVTIKDFTIKLGDLSGNSIGTLAVSGIAYANEEWRDSRRESSMHLAIDALRMLDTRTGSESLVFGCSSNALAITSLGTNLNIVVGSIQSFAHFSFIAHTLDVLDECRMPVVQEHLLTCLPDREPPCLWTEEEEEEEEERQMATRNNMRFQNVRCETGRIVLALLERSDCMKLPVVYYLVPSLPTYRQQIASFTSKIKANTKVGTNKASIKVMGTRGQP